MEAVPQFFHCLFHVVNTPSFMPFFLPLVLHPPIVPHDSATLQSLFVTPEAIAELIRSVRPAGAEARFSALRLAYDSKIKHPIQDSKTNGRERHV